MDEHLANLESGNMISNQKKKKTQAEEKPFEYIKIKLPQCACVCVCVFKNTILLQKSK